MYNFLQHELYLESIQFLLLYLLSCFAGIQWLHSRIEVNGYEEYSGTEYHSAGWSEEYNVIE